MQGMRARLLKEMARLRTRISRKPRLLPSADAVLVFEQHIHKDGDTEVRFFFAWMQCAHGRCCNKPATEILARCKVTSPALETIIVGEYNKIHLAIAREDFIPPKGPSGDHPERFRSSCGSLKSYTEEGWAGLLLKDLISPGLEARHITEICCYKLKMRPLMRGPLDEIEIVGIDESIDGFKVLADPIVAQKSVVAGAMDGGESDDDWLKPLNFPRLRDGENQAEEPTHLITDAVDVGEEFEDAVDVGEEFKEYLEMIQDQEFYNDIERPP